MKTLLMAGAALLTFGGAAMAQDHMGHDMSTGTTAAEQPPVPAQPDSSAPPPAADPNANVPQGSVPDTTGMAPADPSTPADPAAPAGTSANPVTVGGNTTPPPAPKDSYPTCTKKIQDSCRNPGGK